ncbi:MAG: tRNA (adenosine(37)-N6)-threonylcarbamoyltransferase complex dimerization subunit type 1 TsaB [Actinobacteria bacterium]|nr:tRNA (adenosine(37)-N6)-threonylcarbamoyltransferase complex dimerization subunit type 1 TsaB [Actinomycetota bacterium]
MNILGIDSTTKKLTVAVSRDNMLLCEVGSKAESNSEKHMVNIIRYIDSCLARASLGLKDINIFGVNLGPGDFTGTRIGVSVIKILSWVEGKPAYGVNSLDVFSAKICCNNILDILEKIEKGESVIISPCLDVRRNELYFSFYNVFPGDFHETSAFKNITAFLDAGDKFPSRKLLIERLEDYKLVNKEKFLNEFIKYFESFTGIRVIDSGNKVTLFVGGNAFLTYPGIFLELKNAFKTGGAGSNLASLSTPNASDICVKACVSEIWGDQSSFYPGASFVNMCAYVKALTYRKPGPLVPVYVREFMCF